VKYKFDCGCEFEITNCDVKENDGLPSIYIDYENIPEDCPATWQLIQSGHTKGVFQLETNLGRKWAKELAPSNVTEMAALVSLMRPGCLRAIVDGKSMTQHYCDRKNAGDEVKYFHTALEPILRETYAVLTYQEQSMRIAQDIAGFDLQEADVLRKAIGKKKADIMTKVKKEFIEGCKKTGIVSEEEAEEIFGWIQESQRYSFNKSHGVSYGLMGYWSAYVKAHFPFHFYTSWLYYSHEKMDPQEEMQLLISDARYFDIQVKPPALQHVFQGDIGHFALYDDCVYFGVGDIKRIGEALVSKIVENVRDVEKHIGRTIDKWTWNDFLLHFSDSITTTAVNGMVASGATDYMKGSRVQKIHEYETWKQLTQKERDWIRDNYYGDNLIEGIELMLHNKPRNTKPRMEKVVDLLYHAKNAPFSLEDTAYYIAQKETELLGVPITCTKLDTCNGNREPDTTCKEFLQGKSGKMSIAVEITEAKEYIISKGKMKGQKMMFVSAEDSTASLDSITIFPRILEGNEPLLIKGSTVLLSGQRDRQRSESFIVDGITQI
jgi:DNA polymerase III alpha subunit